MSDGADTAGRRTKFFYGIGAVAYGVKDSGFSYFLLLYYSQVLGLPQQWVGSAIFIALILDAFSDPVVGSISDNLHSRWGRRHPFMYGAALPMALSYYLLWNPPTGLSPEMLFAWFICLAILVRLFITFYEIPSSSLVAELTNSYHERTSFLSYRHFFGWWGGLSMTVISYAVLLVPDDEHPVGVLNPAGYETYGLMASLVMLAAVLLTSAGTHRHIPYLRQPPPKRPMGLGVILRDTARTVSNRSFAALFVSAIFGAIASGMATSMHIYLTSFYWELDNKQLSMIAAVAFGSAFLAFWVAPLVSRLQGKKIAAIGIGVAAASFSVLPYVLRMLGWFPENGTSALFFSLMGLQFIDITLLIVTAILIDSMIADVVEEAELATGRRSEGVFFAARNFVRKSVSGVGVVMATTLLTLVNFPEGASPGEVDPEVIFDLGLYYVPLLFIVHMTALSIMFGYRISQARHEANLDELTGRRS